MQISLKWINELINIEKIQLDELIEKLKHYKENFVRAPKMI